MCKENESTKDDDEETCIICGCPLANDDEIGRGCINGGCPTNIKEVKDYADENK